MIPTDEEKAKILEAQLANPDIPLGTAEQFLLTLSSISELYARLKVWLFKLEYESIEMVRASAGSQCHNKLIIYLHKTLPNSHSWLLITCLGDETSEC